MRFIWPSVFLVTLAACGGGEKKTSTTPTSVAGSNGADDLKIPKVDPSLCDTRGKKVITFDLNQDGKPDVWKLIQEKNEKGTVVEVMTCKQVDFNHDGKK